jgi:hypothetical protein
LKTRLANAQSTVAGLQRQLAKAEEEKAALKGHFEEAEKKLAKK